MNLAKSHKIILIITAVALSVMLALCSINLFSGKAEAEAVDPSATNYFTADNCAIDDNGAKFTFDGNSSVEIKNQLAIDNATIKFADLQNIAKLEMVLTYDSFYVNGNKKVDGSTTTYEKEITNKFEIDLNTFANQIAIEVDNTVDAGLVKNQVIVNGDATHTDVYYKIRKVDNAVAKISFNVELTSGATSGSFIITDINQKELASKSIYDESYNQSLKTTEGKLTPAKPIVSLDADMFVRGEDGKYTLTAFAGQDYALSYKVYSVLGNVQASDLNPSVEATAKITLSENNKKEVQDKLYFRTDAGATETFSVSDKNGVVASFTATILKEGETNNAPYYLTASIDNLALEAFKAELEKQYKKEDGKFVPLGTEIEIPSMEDFVYDDRTPYDKLTKKVYYANLEEKSASSMEFKLENVGGYYFYVVFTDSEDEAMEKDDFMKIENDVVSFGQYGASKEDAQQQKYIFYFSIDEDSEIVITAPSKQGKGYKGTRYTASKFEITASNCTITYKLEYATSEDATEWVEIVKFSEVEEDEEVNGYDYETLEAINYNGEYTFTPDKTGVYKITVSVTSKMSHMSNTESMIINVDDEAKVITPSSLDWIKDNVWSVVFLSVGTLCLIGIIVLLCIKPKEKKDEE